MFLVMVRSEDEHATIMLGEPPSLGIMQALIGWKDHMEEGKDIHDA